jgi:hypothetical protein
MVSAWCIWNERSAFIFGGTAPSLSSWQAAFKWEILLHLFRIKAFWSGFAVFRFWYVFYVRVAWFSFLFLSFFSSVLRECVFRVGHLLVGLVLLFVWLHVSPTVSVFFFKCRLKTYFPRIQLTFYLKFCLQRWGTLWNASDKLHLEESS